jgi:hypothetical protein
MKYSAIPSLALALLVTFSALGQNPKKASKLAPKTEALVFAYFKGNGEDGLHLASSTDGYTWTALNNDQSFLKPVVSKDKLMRDPCIIRGQDGLFHMVWTTSWHERGIGYASSPDLIHWSDQLDIPVMAHEPEAKNCWAPEITYDAPNGRYMIYWATTIPGRFSQGETTLDGGLNHRIYYVTTRDFKIFTPARVLYDQNFNVIDATVQLDEKRFVMFLKDETREPVQKNLRVAFADHATGPWGPPSAPITGKYWAEGPTATKLGNQWLVYFDKYTEHQYGAVASTDLEHWTDVSDRVHFPKGTRHGTVLRITPKELAQLQKSVAK